MVGLHGVYICWDGCAGEGTGGSSCLTGSIRTVRLKSVDAKTPESSQPVFEAIRSSG